MCYFPPEEEDTLIISFMIFFVAEPAALLNTKPKIGRNSPSVSGVAHRAREFIFR